MIESLIRLGPGSDMTEFQRALLLYGLIGFALLAMILAFIGTVASA